MPGSPTAASNTGWDRRLRAIRARRRYRAIVHRQLEFARVEFVRVSLRARLSPRPEDAVAREMSRLRLRHDADIGLGRLPALRVLLLGFVVADRTRDDHVLAVLPIHRRRHLVLGGELQHRSRATPRRNCGRWSSDKPERV